MKYRKLSLSSLYIAKRLSYFPSCNTSNGPAVQLSIACSAQAISSIIDLYQNEDNIRKTIQIVDVEKVLRRKRIVLINMTFFF